MNARAILSVPWRAARPSTAWLGVVLFALGLFGAVALGLFSQRPDKWIACTMIVGFCEAFLWAFVMSCTVLLAIDARQLRLPALQQGVVRSLWIYGPLSVALPTIALGLFFGHFMVIASMLGLFSAGGFLFALLPRFLGVLFYMLPLTLNALPAWFGMPSPKTPHFVSWSAPILLGLILAAAWCWRSLLRRENPRAQGWSQPIVMQFRGCARTTGWNPWTGFIGSDLDFTSQIRRWPDWMQGGANLRDCGRSRPVPTLRVALGGVFLPLTALGWLRKVALIVVPGIVFIVLATFQQILRHGFHAWLGILQEGGLVVLVLCGAFGSMLLALLSLTQLGQRWARTNAEMPLLALLPGLGDGMELKRSLLRAIWQPTLRLQAVLLVAVLAIAWDMHMNMQAVIFLLLTQLGAAGFVIAFGLLVVGGCLPGRWPTTAMGIFGCILISVSLFVPTLGDPATIRLSVTSLQAVLAAGWVVLALMLLQLARRGWLGLRQRAHPFLPIDG
ncbi:MAG TPA: hypothetical protein VFE77_05760 [Rhodanobacter sp.]|nr:hypothetical protein [Rhodanobacter sp.]